jgi:hypothetical protein
MKDWQKDWQKEHAGEVEAVRAIIDELVDLRQAHSLAGCAYPPLCFGPQALALLGNCDQGLAEILAGMVFEIDKLRTERVALVDRAEDLDNRLAAAQAELTAWEDSADVLGPVRF